MSEQNAVKMICQWHRKFLRSDQELPYLKKNLHLHRISFHG